MHACTESQLRDKLVKKSRQRHLNVWHDHSDISGHSHFLVLASAVYDPAFYLTPTELDNKGISLDIQTVVEEPEIHILARSASSLQAQQMFSQCRKECVNNSDQDLNTQQGTYPSPWVDPGGVHRVPVNSSFFKINGNDLLNFLLVNSRLLHNISAIH
jgi:hypothetical protein